MILLIIFSLLFLYLFDLFYWKRRNLPPGPLPLPVVGNLYLMTKDVKPGYKMYEKLTEQYGPVFTFWMANLPMVNITDWNLIKQHFIKDGGNFVGRPEFPISIEIRKGAYGIIESHGDRWVQQRRFALHVLRDFGLGKNLMEEKVLNEVTAMIDTIKKSPKDVDMQNIFDASVGSVINNFLFGYRYDESNMAEFLELKDRMTKHFKLAAEPIGGLVGMYPWLGYFPYLKGFKNGMVTMFQNLKFIDETGKFTASEAKMFNKTGCLLLEN